MFGFGDRLYAYRKKYSSSNGDFVNWSPEFTNYEDNNTSWFCFVSRNILNIPTLRKGLMPVNGDVYVYKINAMQLITPNPQETLNGLQEIYDDAIKRMQFDLKKGRKLSIMGVSLGNVLAVKAAGEIDNKIDSLVCLVGGGRLGLSAWDSLLTGPIAKQSHCSTSEEYESQLSEFSPVNYVSKLKPKKLFMRLGKRDLFIPYVHGLELANAILRRKAEYDFEFNYREFKFADHTSTLFLSAYSRLGRII